MVRQAPYSCPWCVNGGFANAYDPKTMAKLSGEPKKGSKTDAFDGSGRRIYPYR